MRNNSRVPVSRRRFAVLAGSAAAIATFNPQPKALAAAMSSAQLSKGDDMNSLTPYLLFDGNCASAMEFYKSVFGGELALTKVKDSAAKDQLPAFQQEKVLNARLQAGIVEISASDWLRPDETPVRGNTVCMYLNGGSLQRLKDVFGRLSAGADVTDPLKEQFFGAYGALNDKFGVRWMFQTNSRD